MDRALVLRDRRLQRLQRLQSAFVLRQLILGCIQLLRELLELRGVRVDRGLDRIQDRLQGLFRRSGWSVAHEGRGELQSARPGRVDQARKLLESEGVRTVLYKVYPAESTDFTPIASAIVAANPDLVVAGTGLRDLVAFIQTFKQQHFNPKALIAAGGADAGDQFSSAIGNANTEGILIPGPWDPSLKTPQNSFFVTEFTKKYGGKPADVSTTSAEAFATGQFAAAVVTAAGSLDQQKLADTAYAQTIQSILGPIHVDRASAQNVAGGAVLRMLGGDDADGVAALHDVLAGGAVHVQVDEAGQDVRVKVVGGINRHAVDRRDATVEMQAAADWSEGRGYDCHRDGIHPRDPGRFAAGGSGSGFDRGGCAASYRGEVAGEFEFEGDGKLGRVSAVSTRCMRNGRGLAC